MGGGGTNLLFHKNQPKPHVNEKNGRRRGVASPVPPLNPPVTTCIRDYQGTISQPKREAAAAVLLIWIPVKRTHKSDGERVKFFTGIKDNDVISCLDGSVIFLRRLNHTQNPDSNGQFPAMNYLNLTEVAQKR